MTRLKHFFSQPHAFTPRKRPQFLAAWIRSPLKMGAFTPSSKALARAMASYVDLSKDGMVVELGAGTGALTYALSEMVPMDRLLIVERDPHLYNILHAHFPQLKIVRADAAEIGMVLEECGIKKICAVVSSLPLLSMPRGIRMQIEGKIAAALGDDGKLIQFTYGPSSPIPHDRWHTLRLYGKRKRFIVSNVPPAHIWVYKRDRRIKKRD